MISNKTTVVNGTEIFYREAGDKKNPSILLLHGFPSSSVMFKTLMATLESKYHMIAPDFPGFGFSGFPSLESFEYSFDNIASCIDQFIDQIGLDQFYIYLHDYGSTIGLRVCLNKPERILGIIIQNGNAYEEGLGPQWDETKDYWLNQLRKKNKRLWGF